MLKAEQNSCVVYIGRWSLVAMRMMRFTRSTLLSSFVWL